MYVKVAKFEIKGHFFRVFKFFLLYKTDRFHVAVRLFSNGSQMTSKCGKNKKVAHEAQPSVSLMFLPHFDVLCNLLLNRRTATWNLFVKRMTIFFFLTQILRFIFIFLECYKKGSAIFRFTHSRGWCTSHVHNTCE